MSHVANPFPSFEAIEPYTKTFLTMSNLFLDLEKLFEMLPITDYTMVPKKRGRKKKEAMVEHNVGLEPGSIITLEYKNLRRGVDLKNKKNRKKKVKFFRNAVTIVIYIGGKMINTKVSSNGKFQMTGCKNSEHIVGAMTYLWEHISQLKESYRLLKWDELEKIHDDGVKLTWEHVTTHPAMWDKTIRMMLVPVMRNIHFSLGFLVDREKLDRFFNSNTPYYSLLETSFGYTGVNIKFPLKKNIMELKVETLELLRGEWVLCKNQSYSDYIRVLKKSDRNKNMKKKRYSTFLVFHSGKAILSSVHEDFSKKTYYEFTEIIRGCKHNIEEHLD
jgi:TATA-box binding protein (TBP) (component of TFIID and TFIIIB)